MPTSTSDRGGLTVRPAAAARPHQSDPLAVREAVRAQALSLGFDAVGFAAPELGPKTGDRLREFLGAGRHGDMDWLAAKAARRADSKVLWPDVRSVIALGVNYGPEGDPMAALAARAHGNISVYARGDDYHDTVKRRLKTLGRWLAQTYGAEVKVFVDTAPVMEKPLAAVAGLGWQGKHTNLVSRRFGSWLFLGEVFTTLDLAPDAAHSDRCGTCHACLDVCPTDAFPAPYRLDARRCISYLTIEHKGHIAREFRVAMGNRIYGCDDCLAVCPWNKYAQASRETAFHARAELTAPRLIDLAGLDDAAFRELFRRSPIKRTGRDRFVRNVLIALGNSGDPAAASAAETLLDDESPLVRAMAVWALVQLLPPPEFAKLKAAHSLDEADPDVAAEWETAVR
ncbi:MAG: tRNA epoxyqueuosine(34) reductase QueG [Proteobacteria bacterium]|nr:tRNA epoxyqueuosine(34) reductase QueG [Pseudomonadota bacterium]